jgi:uncharacterized protein with GYD domain
MVAEAGLRAPSPRRTLARRHGTLAEPRIGGIMPRYLIRANYTLEGLQGLLKEGGTGRRKAIETLASSLGGHLVSLDFAFGEDDVYAICEMPDDETAAAVSLRITASGAVTVNTTKLLSPEQIDAATQLELEYRKPGA